MTVPVFDLPPRPWTRLPDPPADPTQHLAFWLAVGHALGLSGATMTQVEDEASLHERPPLVQAADELNAPVVATLLENPALRAWLVEQSQPAAWRPGASGEDETADRGDEWPETPLDAVLYRRIDVAHSNNPADEAARDAWLREAPLAQEAIVALLLAAGAVPTPIAWLAVGYAGNPALVDRLMASGHAPMRMDHPQAQALGVATTAVHLAARSEDPGAPAAVARLLEHGWPADAPCHDGRTPLYEALTAARPGQPAVTHGVVAQLLAAGAATEWPAHGDHAMVTAARQNNPAGADALLEHGLGHLLNRPASDDLTPLNHALNAGHVAMALHLLNRGAEPDANSLPQAMVARARVGAGGMFPLPAPERARWERLFVALETHALRHTLPDAPGVAEDPMTRPPALPARPRGRL